MGRRIIRKEGNVKSRIDFLLIPLIRLFIKEDPKSQTETGAGSEIYYMPGEEKGKESLPSRTDTYIEQVVKYIPSEIVAAYLFLDGILKSSEKVTETFFWGVFLFLLAATPAYIWAITAEKEECTGKVRKPAWDQIVISFFSFAVWVFAIGGPFTYLSWYHPVYGSSLLVLFTFLPPIISKIICRSSAIISCGLKGSLEI